MLPLLAVVLKDNSECDRLFAIVMKPPAVVPCSVVAALTAGVLWSQSEAPRALRSAYIQNKNKKINVQDKALLNRAVVEMSRGYYSS